MNNQRGYFGIGVETLSKPMNAGNLLRSAHAFGAGFFFLIAPSLAAKEEADAVLREIERSDTASSRKHLPTYCFASPAELALPTGCPLIGVELLDEAIDLPLFTHPPRAAYILGPERGSLSEAMLARTDACIRIPTRFCINLGVAGAVIMYDRILNLSSNQVRRPLFSHQRTRKTLPKTKKSGNQNQRRTTPE